MGRRAASAFHGVQLIQSTALVNSEGLLLPVETATSRGVKRAALLDEEPRASTVRVRAAGPKLKKEALMMKELTKNKQQIIIIY